MKQVLIRLSTYAAILGIGIVAGHNDAIMSAPDVDTDFMGFTLKVALPVLLGVIVALVESLLNTPTTSSAAPSRVTSDITTVGQLAQSMVEQGDVTGLQKIVDLAAHEHGRLKGDDK